MNRITRATQYALIAFFLLVPTSSFAVSIVSIDTREEVLRTIFTVLDCAGYEEIDVITITTYRERVTGHETVSYIDRVSIPEGKVYQPQGILHLETCGRNPGDTRPLPNWCNAVFAGTMHGVSLDAWREYFTEVHFLKKRVFDWCDDCDDHVTPVPEPSSVWVPITALIVLALLAIIKR